MGVDECYMGREFPIQHISYLCEGHYTCSECLLIFSINKSIVWVPDVSLLGAILGFIQAQWKVRKWKPLTLLFPNHAHKHTLQQCGLCVSRWRRSGDQYHRDGCWCWRRPGEAGHLRQNRHRGRSCWERRQVRAAFLLDVTHITEQLLSVEKILKHTRLHESSACAGPKKHLSPKVQKYTQQLISYFVSAFPTTPSLPPTHTHTVK